MNRSMFFMVFILYIAINAMIDMTKMSIGHDWFSQWIFDKFFVFQFMSVVTIGLVIESSYFHNLSYIRMGSRRAILRKELLGYYSQGFICLTIMFMFIVFGALLLRESHFILQLIAWYIRYLLGIVIFINVMSCLESSNNLTLRKYSKFITFVWLAFEILLLQPYINRLYSLDINLLFSWVFHKGAASYYYMLIFILITTFLNIRMSDKRDFI